VFVDIDPQTLNINPFLIEAVITERTKAILPVHVFGQPADMEPILEIARKYELAVIEDACEAIGAEYMGGKAGSFGDASIFAFYPNKQITTGEGGVILTDDKKIAYLCRSMRNQGRGDNDGWLCHERLGYNYRLDELSCALGIAQLERLEEILDLRKRVAGMYNERLSQLPGLEIPYISPKVNKISWFVYVVRLERGIDRDRVMSYLQENGVQCRPYFPPIHLQPFYVEMFGCREGDFPITESIARRTIALPFFNRLSEEQVDYVCKVMEDALKII